MGFWSSTIIIAATVSIAYYFWERLHGEKILDDSRWFWIWTGKGLAVPMLVWVMFNCGSAPWLVRVFRAKLSGAAWFSVMLLETVPGIMVIASFWLALTSGWWLLQLISQRRKNWDDHKAVILLWGMLLAPVAGLVLLGSGLWGLGFALAILFFPILYNLLGIEPERQTVPRYSTAIAKIKFGKYAAAEQEVISQLEKFENDFDGWLMLAELYAVQFKDFAEAEATIRDLCNQPTTNAAQVSIALHKLADWQLRLNQNPDAARRALNAISGRFPGTHLAKMARLRINQLPANRQEWLEHQGAKTVHLPVLDELNDDETAVEKSSPDEARRQAAQCVAKLNREPDDIAAREKLARLYAEQLAQPELGIEQLELLLKIHGQPDGKKAEWLGRIGEWHFRFRGDAASAKIVWERLVSEFPNSQQAFSAQRKLNLFRRG